MSTHNYLLTHAYTDHTNQQCHTKAQPSPHEIRVSRKYAGRPKVQVAKVQNHITHAAVLNATEIEWADKQSIA